MSANFTHDQIKSVLDKLNFEYSIHLNVEDFRSDSYSASSMTDILTQKIADELNGEWTTDMAFHKLRSAIVGVLKINEAQITQESDLNALFPTNTRKSKIKEVGEKLGFPIDVLKPNSVLYGLFIFLFFACIPFGIGMDWFFSGIAMIIFAIIIYILGKTGNSFKMKTVGHLADHLAWKNYLQQKRKSNPVDVDAIRKKVSEELGA